MYIKNDVRHLKWKQHCFSTKSEPWEVEHGQFIPPASTPRPSSQSMPLSFLHGPHFRFLSIPPCLPAPSFLPPFHLYFPVPLFLPPSMSGPGCTLPLSANRSKACVSLSCSYLFLQTAPALVPRLSLCARDSVPEAHLEYAQPVRIGTLCGVRVHVCTAFSKMKRA